MGTRCVFVCWYNCGCVQQYFYLKSTVAHINCSSFDHKSLLWVCVSIVPHSASFGLSQLLCLSKEYVGFNPNGLFSISISIEASKSQCFAVIVSESFTVNPKISAFCREPWKMKERKYIVLVCFLKPKYASGSLLNLGFCFLFK